MTPIYSQPTDVEKQEEKPFTKPAEQPKAFERPLNFKKMDPNLLNKHEAERPANQEIMD